MSSMAGAPVLFGPRDDRVAGHVNRLALLDQAAYGLIHADMGLDAGDDPLFAVVAHGLAHHSELLGFAGRKINLVEAVDAIA